MRSRSGRIGERVGSIPQYAVKRAYTVNGVKYVVGAKFRHWQSKDNFADRIKKFITSDFAHLSVDTQDDMRNMRWECGYLKRKARSFGFTPLQNKDLLWQ